MDALAMPWANARAAHLLAIRRMTPVEVGDDQEGGCNTNQDGPLMYTQKLETLKPFSSHVIPMKTAEAYLGEHLNVMVQALLGQDVTLPLGPHHAEYVYRTEEGQQESGSGGVEPHCLPPNSLKERPPWQWQWLYNQYLKSPSLGICKFKMKCALTPKPIS